MPCLYLHSLALQAGFSAVLWLTLRDGRAFA
jgi:hypothetical protein